MAKMSSPQKDGKNPHTKLKMTKMSHHQKRWQNMSHLQERWQKYVAPPKSRIVKKDDKKCRKIGQN